MNKIILAITFLNWLTNPFTPPAGDHAYLDPGSGSFILQLVLAALLGGLFILRGYWKKIIDYFRKSDPGEEDDAGE